MLLEADCEQVASFATLSHFRRESQPQGAADRCLDCRFDAECAYSARRIYLEQLARGNGGWPVEVVAAEPTEARVLAALRSGPYGRCVYACDNDVPDHQVVILEFAGGRTASLTLSAFTPRLPRRTTLMGTHGWLVSDGHRVKWQDFRTGGMQTIELDDPDSGHGGGDGALVRSFLEAVASGDGSTLLSGPDETLKTHLTVFAAERARREHRVVRIGEV
jgi:predicted dehydrogenase